MPVSMQQIRGWLDVDEPDYPGAARLGREALPHLRELAAGRDPMLASKATYLASLIGGDDAVRILRAAADRPEPEVRVAAASAMRNVEEPAAVGLADRLLSDSDVGVRKVTLRSAAAFRSSAIAERVARVAQADPEPALRSLAEQLRRTAGGQPS